MLYGRLLDKNSYRCEALTDLSNPAILLQGGESRSDRFVECLRGDLYGVLDVSKILYRNCARSKNHVQKRSIFAFYSPLTFDRGFWNLLLAEELQKGRPVSSRSSLQRCFRPGGATTTRELQVRDRITSSVRGRPLSAISFRPKP